MFRRLPYGQPNTYPTWQMHAAAAMAAQVSGVGGGAASSLLTDLTAYWKLDDLTWSDSVGSANLANNNGVTVGLPKLGAGSAEFGGINQYLSVANVGAFGDTDFTIAGWFNVDTTTSALTMISRYTISGDNREWLLRIDNGAPTFFVNNDGIGAPDGTVAASAVSAGVWHFVVAWHDSVGNTINIQVDNGTPITVPYSAGVYANSSPLLFIGTTFPSVGEFMDGLVDEVGLWNRVLTSTERGNLYNSGSGLSYPFS